MIQEIQAEDIAINSVTINHHGVTVAGGMETSTYAMQCYVYPCATLLQDSYIVLLTRVGTLLILLP